MVVSIVVCLRNMSTSKFGRLSEYEKVKASFKSVTFVCGFELYVCVYLVYICVDEVGVCTFGVTYD